MNAINAPAYNERSTANKWVRGLHEPLAGLDVEKSCVAVADIQGDDDYKIVLVDAKSTCRLVLFDGLTEQRQEVLGDYPIGIVAFYGEVNNDPTPCIAVASRGGVRIYRNMRPYYPFVVPQVYLHPPEVELWERTSHDATFTVKQLNDGLQECLKDVGMLKMTDHSLQFFAQKTERGKAEFLERIRNGSESLSLTNVRLSCIATIKRNRDSPKAVDVLVLGAEMGAIYFVDTQAFTVLSHHLIKAAPVQLLALGLYDVEYRVFIMTRGSDVIILRREGRSEPIQRVFYLRHRPIGMIYSINQLVFATRDQRVMFYSASGKCLNEMRTEHPINDIATFYYEPKQFQGILLAVRDEILLYVEMFLVDRLRMEEPVKWVRFGRVGREDGVLLVGLENGGLCAKIFRRTATLGERAARLGQPLAQTQKLSVPRRSKAFIDQSLRERENPQRLHQIFQRDLFMLRYNVSKTFADLHTGKTELMPARETEPVDFNLDLLGFGPVFEVIVNICATREIPSAMRTLMFDYDSSEYQSEFNSINVPDVLPAGVMMRFATHITCLHPDQQTPGELRVLMIRKGQRKPVFASTLQLPVSEPDID